MGKNKDETPNPTNRDILQRLNFLYQASVFLNGLAPLDPVPHDDDDTSIPHDKDTTTNETPHPKDARQKKRRRRVVSTQELSRSYVETMKSVGQKTNVRMDPSVKRRICKRCSAPLVPGVSATVRIKDSPSHGHLVSYRCHCCQTERRIPAPPTLHLDPPTNGMVMRDQHAETSSTPSTDPTAAPSGNSTRPGQKRKKRELQPRLPPHFARDVGHIVFRGDERLDTMHSMS